MAVERLTGERPTKDQRNPGGRDSVLACRTGDLESPLPVLGARLSQPLSDWLLFAAPRVRGRLAIDGRFEAFDHRTFLEVDALSDHPVRIAPRIAAEDLYVLAPGSADDGRLVRALERQPDIRKLYESRVVVILRRG